MSQINIRGAKRGPLIDLLSRTDLRHNHELYLCSCYFDIRSAKVLIRDVLSAIKISSVSIFIDRREAILIGDVELNRFMAEINKLVKTKLLVVDHHHLFHTKAYAVVSMLDGECRRGSLVVGSANLTGAGLIGGKGKGNIESLLDTQDLTYISEFVDSLGALPSIEIDDISRFKSSASTAFKLALINSGRFVYKWSGNLRQYMMTRYVLNEKGREGLRSSETNEIVSPLGFNLDSASIGKCYFNFSYESPDDDSRQIKFIRNFGIETHLGHWVPKVILDFVLGEEGGNYDRFKREIKSYWDVEGARIIDAVDADYNTLLNLGVIDPMESGPGEGLKERVDGLLANEIRLWRIYWKYVMTEQPFDISQDELIGEVHDEIISTIESRSSKNKSMKAYLEALEQSSLEPIQDRALLDALAAAA